MHNAEFRQNSAQQVRNTNSVDCAKQCTKGFTCRKPHCGKDHHHLIHSDEVGRKSNGNQANSHDMLCKADNNGVPEVAVADCRSFPGSITSKISSGTPLRVCNNRTTLPSVPITMGVVKACRL